MHSKRQSPLSRLTVLLLVIGVALAGCARPPARVAQAPPAPYRIEPALLRTIDQRILAASVFARHESEALARVAMDDWRSRVRRRIEQVFIPWYSDYWTQQWMAAKVAWYKLRDSEGEPGPETRLVDYLQEQFYERVLVPVSEFVDPDVVMRETTDTYLRELRYLLEPVPREYGIPAEAFDRHLQAIPAIVLPRLKASLYEVTQPGNRPAPPAYAALLGRIEAGNDSLGPSPDRLHAVARSAVTRLVESMTVRGGATAASTAIGGFWGIVISVSASAWGVLKHDRDKHVIEAQLRENLDAALAVMWQELVGDPESVYHISRHIEQALPQIRETPALF